MKIAVVGSRPLLKEELCKKLVNQEIGIQIDSTPEAFLDQSYEFENCDFQDIVECEQFLNGIDCVIHTGLNWRGLKHEDIYSQITDLGCIVNEAIKHKIKIIFVSDALSTGYHSTSDRYDESKLWNQSIDWSLPGFMYHFAEREVFRGIIEGIEASIVRPSYMIGSENDKEVISQFTNADHNSEDSKGIVSIVSRTDIIQLILKLIVFDSFEHRFVNCSGHAIAASELAKCNSGHRLSKKRLGLFSSFLNYFKKKVSIPILNRPHGLNISYDNQRSIEWLGMKYSDFQTTIAEFQ